jgi:hypothetical protein
MTGTTGGVSLRLKKFNLDEMNPLAVIVAIGKRRKVFSSQRLIVAAPVYPSRSCHVRHGDGQQVLRRLRSRMFHPRGFVEKRSLQYIASHKALTEKMKSNRTSWEIRHRSKTSSSWTTWDTMHLSGWRIRISSSYLWTVDISTLFLLTLQYPKGIPRSEDECGLYIHLPGTEHDEQENSLW